jgi:hypothetical protein
VDPVAGEVDRFGWPGTGLSWGELSKGTVRAGRRWQLSPDRVRFTPGDWALLTALLHRLPRDVLERLHLVVRPDTVLRWYRDVITRRLYVPAVIEHRTGAMRPRVCPACRVARLLG